MLGIIPCYMDTGPMQTIIIAYPSVYKDTLLAKAISLSLTIINHVFEHLSICMHFDIGPCTWQVKMS